MTRHVEHHEHFDIGSLNTLAHVNSGLNMNVLEQFFRALEADAHLRPCVHVFRPPLTTGQQPIDSPEFQIFLKFLCCLRTQDTENFRRYFLETFFDNFTAPSVPESLRRRPSNALFPVYFGMRKEFEDLGFSGIDLTKECAKSFARFVITASHTPEIPHGGSEILRHDFKALLKQFEFTKKLADQKHIGEHEIEHELEHIKTEDLIALLAYLRLQTTSERQKTGGGIRENQIPEVQAFLVELESILAKRIAEKLTQGEHPEQGWQRIPALVNSNYLTPLATNIHHGIASLTQHLKHVHSVETPAAHPEPHHAPTHTPETAHTITAETVADSVNAAHALTRVFIAIRGALRKLLGKTPDGHAPHAPHTGHTTTASAHHHTPHP